MPLNYTTITGTFDDGSGNPLGGSVSFTPSETVYAASIPVASVSNPVVFPITGGILQNCKLLATDNSGLSYEGLTGFFYWTVTVTLNGVIQSPWSFFLPHSPSTVDLYTLANTSAGGGGFTSPMTTLGDLIYENATPAAARLAGNATAAKQFLTQTGTGSVSAAPAWGAIATSDLPGSQRPWQFTPEAYGAKGFSGMAADIVTNGTTTITSATANWTGHNGEHIMINGANGTTSGPLLTTIVTGGNGTATLANAAGVSTSGCAAVWGPDDQAAVNSAMSALATYAMANNWFGELFLSTYYVCASAPTQTTTPAVQNAQIPIPYPNVNGQTRKLVVSIKGPSNAGQLQYWESVAPNLQGAGFISMVTAPSTASGTYGEQSVLGGPSGTSGLTGSFANTKVYLDGITIWTPVLTNQYVYDFGYTSALEWGSFCHQSFAPANNVSGATAAHPYLADLPGAMVTQLENSIGVGCRFPMVGNNDDVCGISYASEGILIGAIIADHFACLRVATLYVDVGGRIDLVNGISADAHAVTVPNWSIEAYNGGITCNGSGSAFCPVNIFMDTEPLGGADPVYDVNDNGNLVGIIRISDNGARTNRRPVILNGAPKLKVVNDMIGPGSWAAAPAAPTQGVAQQNTSWRDATVYVSSTASITAVATAGVTTGQTAASSTVIPVRVPSGASYTVTSAGGTLTTHWVLD